MEYIIFANGTLPKAQISLPVDAQVVAADGGARHCLQLGIVPQIVIGDFDSLTEDETKQLKIAGSVFIRHPADKDQTDLELALDFVVDRGADEIRLYGLLGGRWDMSFANIHLLASPRYTGVRFHIIAADANLYILRAGETLALTGDVGDTVSVIPCTNQISGLNYAGLAWHLENACLAFGSPRGVSNRLINEEAHIKLDEGVALIVHIPTSAIEPD